MTASFPTCSTPHTFRLDTLPSSFITDSAQMAYSW